MTAKGTESLFGRRYGVRSDHRLPFSIRLRWPFQSPVVIHRLHRFDHEGELAWDGYPKSWHSNECWCRRV